MRLLRRRKPWPKNLERRRPENAELRTQLEQQHKQYTAARAELAAQLTQENDERIAQVEATVRGLTARLRTD